MTRRSLAILVLVTWVGALGWLGVREFGRRGRAAVEGQQAVSPGAAYYRVSMGESLVGYALIQVDTLAPTDTSPALVLMQTRLLLAGGDAPLQQRFEVLTNAWLTTDLRLWRSRTLRGDPDGVVEWALRVDGDTLTAVITTRDSIWRTVTRLDTVPVPVEAVPLWLATYARPRAGRAASVAAIDLTTLARRRETWTATADSTFLVPDSMIQPQLGHYEVASYDTVQGWRLSATDRSVQVHQWIDENGFPLERWTGGGLHYVRDAFEFAIVGYRAVSDSLKGHSVLRPPPPATFADLRTNLRIRWSVLLPGAEYPPLDAAGPTQRIAGDTVETFEPTSWRGMQALRPLAPIPMVDPRFAPELWPEPRLSPDDTALNALAVELRGGSTNAREAAMHLHGWVVQNVAMADPAGAVSMRPAGAVLASKSGTSEEKAVLMVALARRMGLPARLVGGIFINTRGTRAHTWVEVFIGDWVPMDPCQFDRVASPSHIRLVTGATGRWTDLFPLAAGLVATGRAPLEIR